MPAKSKTRQLIASRTLSLGEVLAEGLFQVPVNQRPWAWEPREVTRLLRDLDTTHRDFFSATPTSVKKATGTDRLPHFLGGVVVYSGKGKASGNPPVVEVVDGQQRMTAVCMLLAGLQETLQDTGADTATSRRLRARLNGALKAGPSWRLQLDREYDAFFRAYVLEGRDDTARKAAVKKYQVTNAAQFRASHPVLADLKKASDAVRRHVKAAVADSGSTSTVVAHLASIAEVLLDQMQCLYVEVTDYKHGLSVFRSLNSTGRALTEADNVKNELFRRSQRSDANALRENYVKILLALPERDINNFLRLRQVAMFGPTQKNQLYEQVVARELEKDSTTTVVEQWLADARRISSMHRPETENWDADTTRYLQHIRTLDVSYAWSLLLAGHHRFMPDKPQSFCEIARLARDFAFRTLTARNGRDVTSLDEAFAEAAALVRANKTLKQVADALRSRDSNTAFRDAFSRYRESRTAVQFYVLSQLEAQAGSKDALQPAELNTSVDIEHILPQRIANEPHTEWTVWRDADHKENADHKAHKNRIGNLLILERDINSQSNSRSFDAKCHGTWPPALAKLPGGANRQSYKDSALALPALLVARGFHQWTPTELAAWQADLADLAVKAWRL